MTCEIPLDPSLRPTAPGWGYPHPDPNPRPRALRRAAGGPTKKPRPADKAERGFDHINVRDRRLTNLRGAGQRQSNAAPTISFLINNHGDPCEIEFVCVGCPFASPPVPNF
jgi:hypothetical protein